MENPNKNENTQNEFFIFHFIETHDERRTFQVTLSLKTKDKIYDMQKIKENKVIFFDSLSYISSVYTFKTLFTKNNFEILVQLHENKDNINNIFEYVIEIKSNSKRRSHNIFLYNIQFKSKNGDFSHSPLNSTNKQYPINYVEELQLYKTVIREIYNMDDKIYKEFLSSILRKFVGKQFNFTYYIAGLLECYNTQFAYNYLISFKYNKIIERGEPNKDQLQLFKENINNFTEDSSIILNNIKKEDQNKILDYLNMIILYFNYYFQKDKLDSMFKSTDINKSLFLLIKNNPDIFPCFFLSKQLISKIIKTSQKFREIKDIIFYAKNCLEFLEILDENKEYILTLYIIEKTDGKKINESSLIQIDKNAKLNEDDNFEQILQLLQNIVKFEIEQNSYFLVVSEDFFKKIINFTNEINYDRLLFIKNLIDNYIKKIEKQFKTKDIDISIHQTGIKFINIGKIKTQEILDFILKDKYYTDKIYEKSSERDINVLKNIKIEEIDNEFIEKWNKIDWITIFKKKEQDFYNIICSLAKNLKDFNILYKLLYEQNKFDKVKVLSSMQNEFIKKCNNWSLDEFNNNSDIISNLILYSDKKKVNINKFLEHLQEKLNHDLLRNLYIKNIINNKEISNNTKKQLTTFIELDKNNDDNIIMTIQNVNKDNEKNFTKIKDLIFEEKDFFTVEETFNMKLLKKLVSKNIIQEKPVQDNIFIKSTLKKLDSIKQKIYITDFKYKDISFFFEEENNDLFLKRICLIFLIKEEDIPKLKNEPKSIYNEVILPSFEACKEKFNYFRKMIISLELICDDYSIFYPNIGKIKMNEIKSLINNIKNGKLNLITSDYENKVNSYINEDLKPAKE